MPSMLQRLRQTDDDVRRSGWPHWLNYNGHLHPLTSVAPSRDGRERSPDNFTDKARRTGDLWSTVAAAVDARATLMSQVSFVWLGITDANRGRRFGNTSLTLLEDTPGGTPVSQLMYRSEWDASLDGNAYWWRNRQTGDVIRLRPDWVDIVLSGDNEVARQVVGYSYHVNGRHSDAGAVLIPAGDVMHWAPEPDPTSHFVGRSWVTSLWIDLLSDQYATDHVSQFFRNAATPSMIVEAPPGTTRDQFKEWVASMDEANAGLKHSGKTMYVVNGVGTTPLGSKINELDLSNITGAVENRVAVRSRVPAVVLGVREAMQGSSLNAGNYGQTRRLWADSWFTPYAQRMCDHVQGLFDPGEKPRDARLSFDPTLVQLLQEDMQDAAAIAQGQSSAIETLHRAGFQPDAAVDAVTSGDMRRLAGNHTGRSSVQLLPDDGDGDGGTT